MFIKDRLDITDGRKYTDEGFLVVSAKIARSGTQTYFAAELGLKDREATENITIFRPHEEVFNPESLNSFSNKPVTDGHPPELVSAANSKKYSVGHSGPEVTQDGSFVTTILHVMDKGAIDKIEAGKVELSNGYTSDIEWTPGIAPDGQQYDGVQTNIRGNHIAIVNKGRCGPECRVSDHLTKTKEAEMSTITIDGVDFEVSDQAAQAVRKLQLDTEKAKKDTEEKEKEMKEKDEEKEKMEKDHKAQMDSMQAKIDDAVSKAPTPEQLDTLVNNRMETCDAARKLIPDFKFEGKDCETIRKEVVAAKCPSVNTDSVSVDYIRARFDMLAESHNPSKHLDEALKKQVTNDGDKTKVVSADEARNKFAERSRNAWKGGAA